MVVADFKGNPLVYLPERFPTIGFLEGEYGKSFLEKYNQVVETTYNDADVLKVLSFNDNVVTGVNPFAGVVADRITREEGLRTATLAELQEALRVNRINESVGLNVGGGFTCEITDLVLRSENGPNEYLARDIAKQIKARQKLKFPLMIPLNGMELVNDKQSDYGLAFKIKQDAKIIHAPILSKPSGYFDSKDIDWNTGLPKKLGDGRRRFRNADSGLHTLTLGTSTGIYSHDEEYVGGDGEGYAEGEGFAKSSDTGRIVLIGSGKELKF